MPVEIRELQITAVVKDSTQQGGEQSSTVAGGGAMNTNAIVSACVEQVLEILKQKNER